MNVHDEEHKLIDSLNIFLHSVSSDLITRSRKTLEWLDDDQSNVKMYLALLHTNKKRFLYAFPAASKRQFILQMIKELNGHFLTSLCDFFEDEVPDYPIVNSLLSPEIKSTLSDEMKKCSACHHFVIEIIGNT